MIQRADLDHKYVGSCFDRQVRIELWDQDKLKNQTALILGVGGLGSVVMMNLLRLGIHKLILVDYDTVDIHNLNRQLMFTPGDVGQSKVQSARKNARFHNLANTQIQAFDGNALTNWQTIITFSKQANIVFNCIDYGDKFDLAVASLCMKLQIPLVMGGNFSTMFTIDYLNPSGKACFLCLNEETGQDTELVAKLHPDNILEINDLSFLPKNDNPISRSSVIVCTICGQLMVSHYLNYLFLHEGECYKTSRLVGYHNTFEIINFDIEIVPKCHFCGDPNYVEPPKEQDKANADNEEKNTQQQPEQNDEQKKEENEGKLEEKKEEEKVNQEAEKVNQEEEKVNQEEEKVNQEEEEKEVKEEKEEKQQKQQNEPKKEQQNKQEKMGQAEKEEKEGQEKTEVKEQAQSKKENQHQA